MSDPAAFFGTIAQVSASAFAIVAALFAHRLGEHRPDIERQNDDVDHEIRRARELVASCATFVQKRDEDLLLGQRVAERLGGGPRPFDRKWADVVRTEARDALAGTMDGEVREVLEQIIAIATKAPVRADEVRRAARPHGLNALVCLNCCFGVALALSLGALLPRDLSMTHYLLLGVFILGLDGYLVYIGLSYYRLHRLGRFEWRAALPRQERQKGLA